jgi:hypothetical protein
MENELPADSQVIPVIEEQTIEQASSIPQSIIDDYINNRVEQYANWYDSKCGPLKSRYLNIKALAVIGGSLVPVLVNVNFTFLNIGFDLAKVLATLLSLMVVIFVSWESVFQHGKQWKNYRSTEQFLRQEAVFFKNKVGFYSEMGEAHAFKIFVERIENAIAQENSVTLDTLTRDSNLGKQGTTA